MNDAEYAAELAALRERAERLEAEQAVAEMQVSCRPRDPIGLW